MLIVLNAITEADCLTILRERFEWQLYETNIELAILQFDL